MSEEQKVEETEQSQVPERPVWDTYSLCGEIEYSAIDNFASLLRSKDPGTPMTLLVRSGGGSSSPANTITDIIRALFICITNATHNFKTCCMIV